MLEIVYKLTHVSWSNFGYLVPALVAYTLYIVLGQIQDRVLRLVLQSVCAFTGILMLAIFFVSSVYHGTKDCLGVYNPLTMQCNMYDHLVAKPGFAYLVACIATSAVFLRSWRILVKYMSFCVASGMFLAVDWLELVSPDMQNVAHSCWHVLTGWLPAEVLCLLAYAALRRYNIIIAPPPPKTRIGIFARKYFINRILRI